MWIKIFINLSLAILLFACYATTQQKPAPLFEGMGEFHHRIKTSNPLAQRYFDQGLIFLYSFEFGESIRSFRGATISDPNCAMCFWGLALALGSKTDMPIQGNELTEAKVAINNAKKNLDPNNLEEKLYISALAERYSTPTEKVLEPFAGLCSSYSQVKGNNVLNYANAMKEVASILPNDTDAKTLYAASLFDKISWNFWHHHKQESRETIYIIKILESALTLNPNHPGANHLYVHIIESSPYPKRALATANKLNELVPISEHMAHMPAHTYYSLGMYHDSVLANQKAIATYQNYVKQAKEQGFNPEIQYLYYHNIDYLSQVASMEGQKSLSISSAKQLAKEIQPLVNQTPFLQKLLTPAILMLARFGEWQAILNLPAPSPEYQYVNGIWHYARGLAYSQNRNLNAAKQELKALNSFIAEGPNDKNLGKPGFSLLQIAMHTLDAVIKYKENLSQDAIKQLKLAVSLQDTIDSFDPPPWYFPVRELLGMTLLKSGKAISAKNTFLEDLKKHPHNPWSLRGLAMSENALNNKKESIKIDKEFQQSWKYADIKELPYPI